MKPITNKHGGVKLIAILILMLFCTTNSFAQDSFTFDGIKYNITDATNKTVEVGDNSSCTLAEVTIPEKVEYNGVEYSVTSIGWSAFSGCSNLTSIDIPESVTSIGDYAFSGCENLTSIDIPESVTSIGDYAFSRCSGLTSIDIPESVTSIGDHAFYGCSSLTSIDIPESVTSIGFYAFIGCENLTSIKLNWEDDDILVFNSDWSINLNNVTLYIPDGEKKIIKKKIGFVMVLYQC